MVFPMVLVECLSLPAKVIEGVGPSAEDKGVCEEWSEEQRWRRCPYGEAPGIERGIERGCAGFGQSLLEIGWPVLVVAGD